MACLVTTTLSSVCILKLSPRVGSHQLLVLSSSSSSRDARHVNNNTNNNSSVTRRKTHFCLTLGGREKKGQSVYL